MISVCVSTGDFQRLNLYSVRAAERVVGVVMLVSEPSRINFRIGPVKAGGFSLTRLRIPGDACVAMDDSALDPQQRATVLRMLVDLLAGCPIRIQWASRGGVLEELASMALESRTHLPDATAQFQPWYWIDYSGAFDDYLASLGASSRQTFRYSVRRLKRDMEHHVRLVRCSDAEQIDEFLRDAEEVSKNTYQWKELGLGLSNRAGVGRRLKAAADLGQLCSYILLLRGKPSAFIEGFRSSDSFIFYQIGFLPELSKQSVGTVAVLETIRDLMESPHPPRIFDFLPGDDGYKRRMSNTESEERSHYLFPRTMNWRLVALGLQGCSALTQIAMKVKRRLRKPSAPQVAKVPAQ